MAEQTKVDVLGFLGREARRFNPEHAQEARGCHDAVSKLIEAVKLLSADDLDGDVLAQRLAFAREALAAIGPQA